MPPLQFAAPPDFSKLENLVPEIKVTPVQRQNIPLRNLSTRDDDEDTKNIFLALAAGVAIPGLENLALTVAEKIPGISSLLEPKVEEPVVTPSAAERHAMLREKAKEIYGGDTVAQEAYIKSRQAARAAIPDSPVPPKDTLTKRLIETGGGLLGGLAAKTPEAMQVYADMYGKHLKAKSDSTLDAAQSRLRTVEERKKLEGRLFEQYTGKATPIKFFGVHPVTGKQISRNGVQIGGDRFVISQGTDYDTVPGSNEIVPEGQTYLNSILTSNTSSEKRTKGVEQLYISYPGGDQISMGSSRLETLDDGRDVMRTYVYTPGKDGAEELVTGDNLWFPITSNQAFDTFSLSLKARGTNDEMAEMFADLTDAQGLVYGAAIGIDAVLRIAGSNPEALTSVSAIVKVADTLGVNLRAVEQIFKGSVIEKVLKDQVGDAEQLARMLRLKKYQNIYEADVQNEGKRDDFLRELDKFRNEINSSYDGMLGGGMQTWAMKEKGGWSTTELASARARLSSQLLQLAYQAAATDGQTGKTLSDKDLANYLVIVGYGEQNYKVLEDKLLKFSDQLIERFDESTNPQVANYRKDPEELARYLIQRRIGITADLLDRATKDTEEGDIARNIVKNNISRAAAAASQFFRYEQVEKDGPYKLIIPTFNQLYGKSRRLSNLFEKLAAYREKEQFEEESRGSPVEIQALDELREIIEIPTGTAPI